MNDIDTAVFVGLSLANIPPNSWDLQIFADHVHHPGTVTAHTNVDTVGEIATLSFTFTDSQDNSTHTTVGTLNWTNGNSTFSIDGASEAPPTGFPQIDAGIQVNGSQVWFRWDDGATLREYRFHTNTNPQLLQDALKAVDNLSPLAATLAKWLISGA
jgi:hypothetical protein